MEATFETEKGLVTISEHSITINDKVYDICSEDFSIGEFEDYVTQEISKCYISDPITKTKYEFILYYEHIAAVYHYTLKAIEEIIYENK